MPQRFRVSIASLLGLVFLLALAFAALREATVLWAQVTTSVALVAISVAILGGALLRGPARAGCLGFAVFGGMYAAVALGPWFENDLRPLLITTRLLDELYLRLPATTVRSVGLEGPGPLDGPAYQFWNDPGYIRHQCIGHALFCLVWSWAGWVLARRFYERGKRPQDTARAVM
jgi:hypothetical protein